MQKIRSKNLKNTKEKADMKLFWQKPIEQLHPLTLKHGILLVPRPEETMSYQPEGFFERLEE